MRKELLIQRYGRGLINALAGEDEFAAVLAELKDMDELLSAPGVLGDFLASPVVGRTKKARALKDIVTRAAVHPKTSRFLLLVIDKDRLKLLPDLVKELPALWDESRGAIVGRVASAVGLTDDQKRRLKARLEEREGRPVSLSFFVEPGLVAGLTVTIRHQVFDVSLKGRMGKLRDIIIEG